FQTGRVPVPPDQELRNLSTSYESALTEFSFLARGEAEDRQGALLLADTFDYALHHDNHGDPITKGAKGSVGVHNGYEDGDIALYNDQIPPKLGKAGDVRLAGFTIGSGPCGSSDFCLVLDGATGGNNAFAILALVRAYEEFQNPQFLSDAETIGTWIISNLSDTSGTGYGGYFVGYDDASNPLQQPNYGKSVENNADIFAALTALSTVTSQLGESEQAADWANAANVAGDFVMRMYDSTNGRFNGGTVPVGTSNDQSEGVCLSSQTQGNDIINVCDFLDSDTFTALAMSSSPRYHNQIDWRVPVQYGWNHFGQGITAGGQTYNGFDIVPTPSAGPNGVAWEFTGQMCAAMEFVDQIYNDTRFQSDITQCISDIAQAQSLAPFGDQLGLVASTMQDGDTLPPIDQCLSTAFQCIPERVALAATNWAIFAKTSLNAFLLPPIGFINIPGALQQISVGFDGTVWGINSSQQIYMYNTQTQSFQQAPGDLMHVAVGSNGAVWGVNSSEQVFRYDSSIQSWDFISSGNLASIAVGADGDVWGLNSAQQIFHFDTTTQSFQEIPGDLAQIAVGFDGAVWGVNSSGQVYRFNPGTQSFEQVPGIMTQIAVGVDGDVWALNNSNGTVYHFDRLSQNWDQIAGTLAQISVGAGNNVWGLDSSGNVFQFNNQMGNFEQVAGNLSQIAAGENGAVWGVNSAGQIFEFTGPTQATGTLHQLPGALTQIAVGV
ncbi:MAG: hypothetical protein JOZ48_07015, partial [Acidobacteriaceae bacterium]|nr:hypothetical protein [Acidobacteriaceae bacterium]